MTSLSGGRRLSRPDSTRTWTRTAVVAAVAAHLLLTSVHGLAHLTIPVAITPWQAAYSAVVLFAGPVLGAGVAWRGRTRTGAWLLLAAGIAALAFEGVAHFVVRNPDHVAAVDAGNRLFASTAGLTVASDVLLVAVAAWALHRHAQGSSATSCSDSTT